MDLLWGSGLAQLWGLVKRAPQGSCLMCDAGTGSPGAGGQEGKVDIKWGERGQAGTRKDEDWVS